MDRRKQRQREVIRAECDRIGIRIDHRGVAYLLRGPDVHLMCADLALLTEADLRPFVPTTEKQARA